MRMLRHIAFACTCAYATSLWAAQPWVETFTGSLQGWTNTASPAWRATTDVATVTFAPSLLAQTATLLTTGSLAGASFTGNYVAANLEMLGFRFRAEHVLPSGLTISWMSGTNGYFRNLAPAILATGVWYQFYFSLLSKDAGAWDGDSPELFPALLTNVERVAISVTKPATLLSSSFKIDDVVVDRLPAAGDLIQAGLRMDYLQTNTTYLIETTTDLNGIWTLRQAVLASNRTQLVTVSNLESQLFWRIVTP